MFVVEYSIKKHSTAAWEFHFLCSERQLLPLSRRANSFPAQCSLPTCLHFHFLPNPCLFFFFFYQFHSCSAFICLCLDCLIFVVMTSSHPTHEEKKHAEVTWIWPFKQINTVTRLESSYFYTHLYVIWPL